MMEWFKWLRLGLALVFVTPVLAEEKPMPENGTVQAEAKPALEGEPVKAEETLIVAGEAEQAAKMPVTADEAAKIVQKKLGGRVLGGKTIEEKGNKFHVVRVLTPDGRVQHIKVDVKTGKIIK